MGRKHKHSQDKLYLTVSELTSRHVGESREYELSALHRRLKFDSCCLTLNTVSKKPMGLCDDSGFCYVFEQEPILKFLLKFHQIHPITGKRATAKDLIELKLHKNADGQYHCPVSFKLLTQHSKIVANRRSGHVYAYQSYFDMNLKPKYFKDLLTDEPFSKSDIVTIQDPDLSDTKWKVSDFYYIKHKLRLDEDSGVSKIRNIDNQSSILQSSLEEYKKKSGEIVETFNRIVGQDQDNSPPNDEKLDKINSAAYSDGKMSSSVTSTVVPIARTQKAALLSEEQIIYPKIKKRAHVQLVTNFGPINLELYCDRTPKTCHNFLLLISKNYYDNTIFHRLVKNFILQGGDPTGTGSGGQSAWGEPFRDEFCGDLKHEGRGVLAMANSGPNSNKSQFYITLRGNWDHLDKKHTVFGRVVGGAATLDKIEAEVETDKNDRPKKEVKLIRAIKFTDPFEEVQLAIARERKLLTDNTKDGAKKRPHESGEVPSLKKGIGVGAGSSSDRVANHKESPSRSLPENTATNPTDTSKDDDRESSSEIEEALESEEESKVRAKMRYASAPRGKSSYGNFDNW